MERVTGIGGIFFKTADPKRLAAWYAKHLGVPVEAWGGASFNWREHARPDVEGTTVWSPFAQDTEYFGPNGASFMVNFRVRDLEAMLGQLRRARVKVDPKVEVSEFGPFGWFTDPDGRRVELWQPPAPRRPREAKAKAKPKARRRKRS